MTSFVRKVFLSILIFPGINTAVLSQDNFPVPAGNKQLFYLQRTPNTNTIVYELNYSNGMLNSENPVHEFWIRYQEKGQREELSYIQRKFAYGLKVKKLSGNRYELSFVSYKKYKMYLEPGSGGEMQVYTIINRQKIILKSIYLKINEGGSFWSPNIEYVEISGVEPSSKSIIKERMKI